MSLINNNDRFILEALILNKNDLISSAIGHKKTNSTCLPPVLSISSPDEIRRDRNIEINSHTKAASNTYTFDFIIDDHFMTEGFETEKCPQLLINVYIKRKINDIRSSLITNFMISPDTTREKYPYTTFSSLPNDSSPLRQYKTSDVEKTQQPLSQKLGTTSKEIKRKKYKKKETFKNKKTEENTFSEVSEAMKPRPLDINSSSSSSSSLDDISEPQVLLLRQEHFVNIFSNGYTGSNKNYTGEKDTVFTASIVPESTHSYCNKKSCVIVSKEDENDTFDTETPQHFHVLMEISILKNISVFM